MTSFAARIADFWHGRLPLGTAFWLWAVVIGAAVNVVATAGTFAALAADLPGLLALAIHLSPLPCNAACVIGVWRSATAYEGPRHLAEGARVAVVVWAVVLTLT